MADEWTRLSLHEWQNLGRHLFGPNVDDWRFVCPNCGHIQTRRDWLSLGMSPRRVDTMLGYTCIGRWKNPLDAVGFGEYSPKTGCTYAGGVGTNISPVTVVISEDPPEERPTFAFSP